MALRWTSRTACRLPTMLRCASRPHIKHQPIISLKHINLGRKRTEISASQLRFFSSSPHKHDSNIVVRVPPMAESITEGTLSQFSKSIGDFIETDEELATIETDKIDVSVNATQAGIVQQLLVAEGDVVTVDQAIAEIQSGEKQLEAQAKPENTQSSHTDVGSQQQSTKETRTPTSSSVTEQAPLDSSKQVAKEVPRPKETPTAESTQTPHASHGYRPSRAEEKASANSFVLPLVHANNNSLL